LTFPKHEIIDYETFYGVTFFCILLKNLLGDFFDNINIMVTGVARRSATSDAPTR
jgi:hypothetical protein